MNKCIFTGRLTKDPVYKKKTAKIDSFVAFSLAVRNGYGDTERTFYVDCTVYGWLADEIHETCYKGVMVVAEGTFYTYDSKYGKDKLGIYLKSCEVAQHTKAYLEEHPEVLKESKERFGDVMNEYVLQIEHKKPAAKKEDTWEKIESMLMSDEFANSDSDEDANKKAGDKLGLSLDEDGFIQVDEDDVDLPFD